jgi:hypothetical protein
MVLLSIASMFLSVLMPVQTTFGAPATRSIDQTTQLPSVQRNHLDLQSYGKLPRSFEANVGQTNADVKFLSRVEVTHYFLLPRRRR